MSRITSSYFIPPAATNEDVLQRLTAMEQRLSDMEQRIDAKIMALHDAVNAFCAFQTDVANAKDEKPPSS